MVDAGILAEDDRVELIRGEVLAMSPIGSPHNGSVLRASNGLFALLGGQAIVSVQGAVRLDLYSEPQPDIALLRPREDFYTKEHPKPSDVFLLVEVSDSSLEFDRGIKAKLYAETGIVEYWVADISTDCVWMYTDPDGENYRSIRKTQRGEAHSPTLLPTLLIPVDALLP